MEAINTAAGLGNPEKKVEDAVKELLRRRGWYVIKTHGNAYQSGVPDLFATHKVYGQRWVEIKLPDMMGSKFTRAQYEVFPDLVSNGAGVWVLTAATDDEYDKLFKKCNLFEYMRPK